MKGLLLSFRKFFSVPMKTDHKKVKSKTKSHTTQKKREADTKNPFAATKSNDDEKQHGKKWRRRSSSTSTQIPFPLQRPHPPVLLVKEKIVPKEEKKEQFKPKRGDFTIQHVTTATKATQTDKITDKRKENYSCTDPWDRLWARTDSEQAGPSQEPQPAPEPMRDPQVDENWNAHSRFASRKALTTVCRADRTERCPPTKETAPRRAVPFKPDDWSPPSTSKNSKNRKLNLSDLKCLGFPNPSQMCYINSCIQSLLTLMEFTADMTCQENVWKDVPEAEPLRAFLSIVNCYNSTNKKLKYKTINSLKTAVAEENYEFSNDGQKDAHEFLICLLNQIRVLRPRLKQQAINRGLVYICPVQQHLEFTMQYTTICLTCGVCTSTKEHLTTLSLRLLPLRSIQEMLDDHLESTDVDFNCGCADMQAKQTSSFETLPRVLILHIPRVRITLAGIKKQNDKISISRYLVVSSSPANGWYRLVSIIDHISPSVNSGHYTSAGVLRDADEDDPADTWIIYNDDLVSDTTGETVCNQSEQTVFILFYKKEG